MKQKIQNKTIYKISTCVLSVVAVFMLVVFLGRADEKVVKYEEHTFSTIEAAQAAVDDGYLYGGLYTTSVEGVVTKYTGVKTPEVGTKYQLKMVPEEILSVEAQVSDGLFDDPTITDDDATYAGNTNSSIRFATGIDALQYKKVGFNITVEGSTSKDADVSQYVHTKLYGVDSASGDYIEYEPTDIHGSANYFKTFTLKNVPKEYYNHDLTIKAYYVTMDGTRVEGTKTIGVKTVNLGRSWVYVLDGATGTQTGTFNAPFASIQDAANYTENKKLYVILKSDTTLDSQVALNSEVDKTVVTNYSGNAYELTNSSADVVTITRGSSSIALFETTSGQELFVTGTTVLEGNSDSDSTASEAMLLNAGTMTIDSDVTVQNGYKNANNSYTESNVGGGAIENKGALTVKGTVTACGSKNYSAIATSGGSVNMNGAHIDENNGRAIRVIGGTLDVTDSTMNYNTLTQSNGGAVLIDNGAGVVSISGTEMCGNTANANGGAICSNAAGVLTVKDCTIESNELLGTENTYGGAIAISSKANTFTLSGGTISGHTVSTELSASTDTEKDNNYGGRGGALYLQGSGTITIDGVTITDNHVEATDYGNAGIRGNGGGIYIYEGCTATINIKDCSITANSATSEGGGIYAGAGTYSLTISDTGSGDGICENNANRGAGIYSVGTQTMTMNGVTLSDNYTNATNGAGLFANGSGAAYVLNDCIVSYNASVTDGGGILVGGNPASLTITGGEFSGNTATVGAGMSFYSKGKLSVSDCTIDGNEATSGGGAGVYVSDSTGAAISEFSGCTVSNNTASAGGGGIRVNKAAETTVNECTFETNTSTGGSGFLGMTGTYEFSNSNFTENTATGGTGGGLQVNDAVTELTLDTCEFTSNNADKSGGAFTSIATDATIVMTSCTFTENSALNTAKTDGRGGAVYINKNAGTTTFTSCVFEGNTTTRTDTNSTTTGIGGAICINSTVTGDVTITGSDGNETTFTNNTTDYRGGALYLGGTGTQKVEYTDFTGNKSVTAAGGLSNNGGAVLVQYTGETSFDHCDFDGNQAGNGGSITWFGSTKGTISNCTFKNGVSKYGSGAVHVEHASVNLTMTSNSFTGCSAGTYGGAMYIVKGTVSLSGCTFTSNTATTSGGAIRVGDGSGNKPTVTLSSCTFTSNSSPMAGGMYMHTGVATLTSCTFKTNKATSSTGGGLRTGDYGYAVLKSCTFTSNTATTTGPNIFNDGTVTFPTSAKTYVNGTEANTGVSDGQNW